MATRKPKTSDPKPVDYSNLFVAGKSAAPIESYGIFGKSYAVVPGATKTLNIPKNKTPVVTDLGSSLRGMQGQNSFDPSVKNTVRAGLAAASIAGISAASTLRIVRDAPESAKKVQRKLANELKSQSTKGMGKLNRELDNLIRNDSLAPSGETTTQLQQDFLRYQVSEIMKSQKGALRIKKR